MLLHTNLWLQWLVCVAVVLNWLITLHILLIWHHPTIFCSPTWKKHLAGKQYGTDDEVMCAVEDFFSRIRMRASNPYHRNPSAATPMKEMCGLQPRLMLKSKPHLVKFDHCIIVSLWTFQPTLLFVPCYVSNTYDERRLIFNYTQGGVKNIKYCKYGIWKYTFLNLNIYARCPTECRWSYKLPRKHQKRIWLWIYIKQMTKLEKMHTSVLVFFFFFFYNTTNSCNYFWVSIW